MIEVKNVFKSYNGEAVLKGVSFTVQSGEFVSIMGKSGSGKSTLLNIIGGFLDADKGSVLFDGKDITSFSDKETAAFRCKETGFVFQSFKLIGTLTARDNILLPAVLGKMPVAQAEKNLKELSQAFHLEEVLDKYPDQLSGGQCQRVAIVRALAFSPKTIILDEPTGALDSKTEEEVMTVLSHYNKIKGMTIIQVTHSEKVASYSSRIIKIKDGELATEGSAVANKFMHR